MLRRMEHWSSTSHIHFLNTITEEMISGAFRNLSASIDKSKRSDSILARLLLGMEPEDTPMDPDTDKPLQISHLFAALNEAMKGEGTEGRLGAYKEITCFEFHRLLVATIVGYKKSLRALQMADQAVGVCKAAEMGDKGRKSGNRGRTSESKLEDLMAVRTKCAEKAWKCWYLFGCIASSGIFSCHLTLLHRSSWLPFPLLYHTPVTPQSSQLTSDTGAETDSEPTSTEENEEYRGQLEAYVHELNTRVAFKAWLDLQLAFLSALRIITTKDHYTDFDKDHPIVFKLIAAQTSNYEMDDWETTLRNLAESPPQLPNGTRASFDAQSIIDLLKRKIKYFESDTERNSVMKAFTPKPDTPDQYNPVFYGKLHSETILISLTKCQEKAIADAINSQVLIEVFFQLRDLSLF